MSLKPRSVRNTLSPDEVEELTRLGQRLGTAAATIQQVSAELLQWLEGRLWGNKQQWSVAFQVFQSTVYKACKPKDREIVWSQIEQVIMSSCASSKGRTEHGCIVDAHVRNLLQKADSADTARLCCECRGTATGIMVSCAGMHGKCKKIFHVGCAAAEIYSKKRGTTFYRCGGCAAKEVVEDKTYDNPSKAKKRPSTSLKGGPKKQKVNWRIHASTKSPHERGRP